jgi:Phosphodiester glycosidase
VRRVPARTRRRLLLALVLIAVTAVPASAVLVVVSAIARPAAGAASPGRGTVLLRVHRAGPGGVITAYVLEADLADRALRADLLYPGSVAAVQTLSAMVRRAGALAAVNGDFFNIGASGAPVGPAVTGGRLLKAPQRGRALVAGVGDDGVGRISSVTLRGFVQTPDGRLALSDLNDANPGFAPLLAPDGIGLFTPQWGSYPRAGAVRGLGSVTELLVRGGRVAQVSHAAGAGPIPGDGSVLLGAGRGGRALARLRPGDVVSASVSQQTAAPSPFRFAIGAKYRLLRGGAVQGGLPVTPGAPRTAIGFSADGHTMFLVVTEGPRAGVPGLDLPELARFLRGLGVSDAANLDDGGSTTIVASPGPHRAPVVLNRPSDGSERRVANGVGLFAAP